ncbi:MAG TPA: tetratricopeptide repeat protein [Rhizobiales bacterium]|nr:tetratricopeptide repeat protein [Hyphomicrobiales bacterium]
MRVNISRLAVAGFVVAMAMNGASAGTVPGDSGLTNPGMNAGRGQVLDRLFGRLHREKSPEAAKRFTQAIWRAWSRSDSPSATVLLGQARRAIAARQYRIAIAILSTVIEQQPQFAEAWNKRATAYFLAGDFTRSISDIKKVLDLEPRHFGALAGLGLIYRRQGKYARALAIFKRAQAINPHLPEVKRAIKELSGKTGQDI